MAEFDLEIIEGNIKRMDFLYVFRAESSARTVFKYEDLLRTSQNGSGEE
jgi:hypothetical protein